RLFANLILIGCCVVLAIMLVAIWRSIRHQDVVGYVFPQRYQGAGRSLSVCSAGSVLTMYGEFHRIDQPPDSDFGVTYFDNPKHPGWRFRTYLYEWSRFWPGLYKRGDWIIPRLRMGGPSYQPEPN